MPDPLTHSFDPAETAAPAADTPPAGDATAAPGYELLEEVGRGGMGAVYRARDLDLDREVAVKLLLPKYAPGSAVAARFVDEARITGQLQHPGIPAVYRVGTAAGGRPFLAMKLIKGRTLADLLADGSPVDPLAVFEAVCQAVGYAHAHGVVHRDLKPQNVMVGSFGEVQVMDWGLAKVLAGGGRRAVEPADPEATTAPTEIRSLRDSDGTFTQAGSVLGTPAYMPPEQAAGESAKLGPRSDVFGLGGLLCVLLTGKPPIDGADAESVRVNAIRGRTEEALARLDACGADPDVVALCKRCLAFEPADRPGSGDEVAGAVAALRRAADDRARQAERDKLAAEVRAAEQAKRRRVQQWAGTAVAVVLAAGITASLWQARAARREADAAEAARQGEADQRAKAEAAKVAAEAKEKEADATVQFFEDKVFAAARPKGQDGGLGKDATLRDAILAALPALTNEMKDQPLVEARLRRVLGVTFRNLGNYQASVEQLERALALFTDRRGPDHPDTLGTANSLVNSLVNVGRWQDALPLAEQVLAARRRLLPSGHLDTFKSMNTLANCYDDLDRRADALQLWKEALAGFQQVLPPDHPTTLVVMTNLARSYDALGRVDEALKMSEEALAGCRRSLPPDHPTTLGVMTNLAVHYSALGRHAEAVELGEAIVAGCRQTLPPDARTTLIALNNLARDYYTLRRPADALRMAEEALAGCRRSLPADHALTLNVLWGVARSLVALRRGAEAVPLIDEFVAKAAGRPVNPQMIPELMVLRFQHYQQAGDPAGCRATAEMWEGLNRPDANSLVVAASMRALAARLYARADQPAEAAADADRAMNWLRKAVEAGFRDRAHLEENADLRALRGRADFWKLVESLPHLAPPPRPRP